MDLPTRESTYRRPAKIGDEQDVFTGWRHILKSYARTGATKDTKQRHNRRERRQVRQRIKEAGG